MTTTPSATPPFPPPPICPQCGYSFLGHPAGGCCPECGLHVNRNHLILFGWGGSAAGARSSRPMVVLILGGLLLIFLPQLEFVSEHPDFGRARLLALLLFLPWYLWVIQFGWALSIAWAIAVVIRRRRRSLRTMPAPVQLRLSPEGFALREGLGIARQMPWKSNFRSEIKKRRDGSHRLSLRGPWGTPWIDLDFDLTDPTAARLAECIRTWIKASAPPK